MFAIEGRRRIHGAVQREGCLHCLPVRFFVEDLQCFRVCGACYVLLTGSVPGTEASNAETDVLGLEKSFVTLDSGGRQIFLAEAVFSLENSLMDAFSWACISSPMTSLKSSSHLFVLCFCFVFLGIFCSIRDSCI